MNFLNHAKIKFVFIICLSSFISACGFQSYKAKPIKPNEIIDALETRSTESESFNQFLVSQNYSKPTPIQEWGLDELTYSALFFHPELNVARAQWRAAQSAQITAAQRPEIGINGERQRHSKAEDVSPWTYSMGIDIGIITAGKIQARIDQARGLSEAARIEIAQMAWQIRSRLAKSLFDYQYSSQLVKVLEDEVRLRTAIVDMLEKRMEAGMASSIELNVARLALQKSQQSLQTELGAIPGLEAILANNAGLPLSSFKKLAVNQAFQPNSEIPVDLMQYQALLNRLDVRASLSRFEAAEAKLRLEIAKQYPDFTLSPSRISEQGDKIWNLSFSSLLTLVNRNRGLIAEAVAQRELQIAQFEALQAKVIASLNQSKANYLAASGVKEKAEKVLSNQENRTLQTEAQFNAGFADRLELTTVRLENVTAAQNVLQATYRMQLAKLELEDAIQRPLNNFMMPKDLENKFRNTQ